MSNVTEYQKKLFADFVTRVPSAGQCPMCPRSNSIVISIACTDHIGIMTREKGPGVTPYFEVMCSTCFLTRHYNYLAIDAEMKPRLVQPVKD